jgi:hypothetical protein
MNWKALKLPEGGKLFMVHTFTYMHKGTTYHFEVDEYGDGTFSGHGEHSTDKSSVLASVSGKSLEEAVNALVASIKK